jgi:hypothetical protein
MLQPIQIAVVHTRGENEQFGQEHLYVLLNDGRIFYLEYESKGTWVQAPLGPWERPERISPAIG